VILRLRSVTALSVQLPNTPLTKSALLQDVDVYPDLQFSTGSRPRLWRGMAGVPCAITGPVGAGRERHRYGADHS
jgi:hypothetical protein